jgi:hypothetical protein
LTLELYGRTRSVNFPMRKIAFSKIVTFQFFLSKQRSRSASLWRGAPVTPCTSRWDFLQLFFKVWTWLLCRFASGARIDTNQFRFVGVDLSKNFLGRFGSHLVHKYLRHNLAESVGKESLRAALFSLGLPVNAPLYGRLGVDSASSDVVSSLTTCPIFHHHPACQRSHHR